MAATENGTLSQGLVVAAMPQRRHVRAQGDDWTGITSTAERRKLQNRLNARAYRHRKNVLPRKERTMATYQELIAVATSDKESAEDQTGRSILTVEGHKMLIIPEHREKVLQFAREAYEHYTLGMPRPTQLQLLIKLNVLNAIARNATLIGIPTDRLCADEAISPFSQSGPLPLPDQSSWPVALRPSSVQSTVSHHPWIDLIPFPIMRDRAIRAFDAGQLDEDEFCLDLLEVSDGRTEEPYLIVWGDSSDPHGWEATLPFMEKYGWMVWGCTEIFESTNAWRARRGEKLLGW